MLAFMSFASFAKKDINAWKSEKNLNNQFIVFKSNLNYWNGSYFLNETQLDQFYQAMTDSISVLKKEISENASLNSSLQNELNQTINQLENTKVELNTSVKNQNAIAVFGMNLNKSFYTFVMYSIVLGLLVVIGLIFLLYNRNRKITVQAKKEYKELKEEFETHKKNSLERYTKINTELHHTRLELNKKFAIRS